MEEYKESEKSMHEELQLLRLERVTRDDTTPDAIETSATSSGASGCHCSDSCSVEEQLEGLSEEELRQVLQKGQELAREAFERRHRSASDISRVYLLDVHVEHALLGFRRSSQWKRRCVRQCRSHSINSI